MNKNILYNVAIIGGGCSGVLVASNIHKLSANKKAIAIIEKSDMLGRGLAYSTVCDEHVLNVPSCKMSGFVDEPEHFINWLKLNNLSSNPYGFAKRKDYATYLQKCLPDNKNISIIKSEAISVAHDRFWKINCESGLDILAEKLVLACGVFLDQNTEPRIINNPWEYNLDSISKSSDIALVGSGLTAVDILLWLYSKKWQGKITVYSNSGELPLAHNLDSYSKVYDKSWDTDKSLLELFREFKQELKETENQQIYWHNIIDSFRPYTQQIWKKFTENDKRRFLRHLRKKWDKHRHRIAPEVFEKILIMRDSGFFNIEKNSITENASLLSNHDYVINCKGLKSDYTKVNSRLFNDLFDNTMVQSGTLGQGIRAVDNKVQDNLYALGYCLNGILWETVAVPELRQQAWDIAKDICDI